VAALAGVGVVGVGMGVAARCTAVCGGQAVVLAAEGRTGSGVSGVQTGVATPTISAIPTPPTGGTSGDQLLLSQALPDWSS
jgi:hypothetical protein